MITENEFLINWLLNVIHITLISLPMILIYKSFQTVVKKIKVIQ